MTQRIVIELEDGAINGVYTDFKDLEVLIVNREDVLTPIDQILAEANGDGEDLELDDKVDVSYDPKTVDSFFRYKELE
jgi:hypothetical protein